MLCGEKGQGGQHERRDFVFVNIDAKFVKEIDDKMVADCDFPAHVLD